MIITWTETRDSNNKVTEIRLHTHFRGRKKIDITKPFKVERLGCWERITQPLDKEEKQ